MVSKPQQTAPTAMIFLSDLIRFSAVCLLSYLHGIRSRTSPNLNNLKLSILLWNLLSAVVSELQYMWRTVILTLWELTIVSYGDSSSQCLPLRGERRVSTCFCLLLVYFVHFSNERPTLVPQWTAITSRVKDFTSANGQGGGSSGHHVIMAMSCCKIRTHNQSPVPQMGISAWTYS